MLIQRINNQSVGLARGRRSASHSRRRNLAGAVRGKLVAIPRYEKPALYGGWAARVPRQPAPADTIINQVSHADILAALIMAGR